MKIKIEKLNKENYGLTDSFHVSPSSCENPDYYAEFIKLRAYTDMISGMGVTYIARVSDHIAAFFTLRCSSYLQEDDGYTVGYPGLEIAEFAVHEDWERKGVGRYLIHHIFTIADDLSDEIGIRYVLVVSDKASVGFYEKCGFAKLDSLGDIPREGTTNRDCIPLYIRLPEKID